MGSMNDASDTGHGHIGGRPPATRRAYTLERFAAAVEENPGVNLNDLAPITELTVRTMNSVYSIVVVGPPGAVMIRGGALFSEYVEARLTGSTLGGSCLKMGWIGQGFSMEIMGPMGRIVTSPIRAITVETASSSPH